MIAGGKSKKTKRTAPKSDDVYLKLLVKVQLNLRSVVIFWFIDSIFCDFGFRCGEENGEQVQCRDSEAFVHEQSEQSAVVSLSSDPIHGWEGNEPCCHNGVCVFD